jgi:hypothetical protein
VFNYWNGQGRNSTDLCEKEYSSVTVNGEKAHPALPFMPLPLKRIPHAPEQRGGKRFRQAVRAGGDSRPALLPGRDLLRRGDGSGGGGAGLFRLALILQREDRDQSK